MEKPRKDIEKENKIKWKKKRGFLYVYGNRKNGKLVIKFKPSKKWEQENPHLRPMMWTNAIAGQVRYSLSPDFDLEILEVVVE